MGQTVSNRAALEGVRPGDDESPSTTTSSGVDESCPWSKNLGTTPNVNNDESSQQPKRLGILFEMPCVSREKELQHAWNPEDRSLNIFVMENDPLTIRRQSVTQSTDGIRGKVGYTEGLHVWSVHWKNDQRGTHPQIGVATADAPLHAPGYTNILGMDEHSWGWNLTTLRAYSAHPCCGAMGRVYPRRIKTQDHFSVPDKFFLVLDMDEGTLGFIVDGKYLGAAFHGLQGKTLYPAVSTVWGNGKVTMRYVNGIEVEMVDKWSLINVGQIDPDASVDGWTLIT